MNEREYRTVDKSKWGRGEWDHEPDKVQWKDETGYPCLVVRSPAGALCGYVGVPEGHPFYGKEASGVDANVHGGVTFTETCRPGEDESTGICHVPEPGEPDHVWWLGFDCAHAFDLVPGLDALPRCSMFARQQSEYRNMAFVKAHCAELARQCRVLALRASAR